MAENSFSENKADAWANKSPQLEPVGKLTRIPVKGWIQGADLQVVYHDEGGILFYPESFIVPKANPDEVYFLHVSEEIIPSQILHPDAYLIVSPTNILEEDDACYIILDPGSQKPAVRQLHRVDDNIRVSSPISSHDPFIANKVSVLGKVIFMLQLRN
jgi:hypothetical protein